MKPIAPADWKGLTVPKAGHRPDENEDALAADPAAGRFAVADGATESCYARLWARLLVDGFVAAGDVIADLAWLHGARRLWADQVDRLAVPWYVDNKRREGARATFLGLNLGLAQGKKHQQPATCEGEAAPDPAGAAAGNPEGAVVAADAEALGDGSPGPDLFPFSFGMSPARGATWQAIAVGDTCLFHLRGGELLRTFPIDQPGQFDAFPDLLNSRGAGGNGGAPADRPADSRTLHLDRWSGGRGDCLPGDWLLVATDALAHWLLRRHHDDHDDPGDWAELAAWLAAVDDDEFADWVGRLRDGDGLRNDDVTVVLIRV